MFELIVLNFMEFIHNITCIYKTQYRKINKNYLFAIWGLIMHLTLLWGVLDANFHSPIIPGLPVVPPVNKAPARRLLLFVADGLRFRTFIEDPPPYLQHVMKNNGTWGVSHTRMPTESRPGNVAIAAGLYEDPSAIFKGWKENPVDFDSVFNQSSFTWAWGSPDIIPMFVKGSKGNVYGITYPAEWQDFDATSKLKFRLDSWVFDKYLEWLQEEANKVKDKKNIIIFLHLLGCDTIGHSHKPSSREYVESMRYVDHRIQEVVQKTESIFDDRGTAYLFTADHGMTDWGSHGSGSTDETETPLIVWGAGVNTLDTQQDVEQADITPLISSLVGISIPVNNEGILPLQYLKEGNDSYGANALLANIKQLVQQVKHNRILSCGKSGMHFDWREIELDKRTDAIMQLIKAKNIPAALQHEKETILLAKEFLSYFRHYQRYRLLMCLTVMWVGWITLLFFKITESQQQIYSKTSLLLLIDVTFIILAILLFAGYKVSGCNNWRLPCYTFFALASLWLATRSFITLQPKLSLKSNQYSWMELAGSICILLAMFFGLSHRWTLGIGMLLVAFMQKVLFPHSHYLLFWTAILLTIFPLLPVVEPHSRVYVVQISIYIAISIVTIIEKSRCRKAVEIIRLVVTAVISLGYIDGRSWLSWVILFSTPWTIWSYPLTMQERILGVVVGLFCPLVLLSASYEPLFFLTLAMHLFFCLQYNTNNNKHNEWRLLSTGDLAKAAIFMFYTLLCFFGTGNMASISSFDPSWTRHFITVFSPFTMSLLILLKLSIPLILTGCVCRILGSPAMFLAVLLLGDCLTWPYIYHVTPHGSWLDIGSAISRFTISVTLPCLLLLLYYISQPLMRFHFKNIYSIIPKKSHIV